MIMTNLGITKEEMIYQFIISLNKGGYADKTYAEGIVEEAIGEYDALVNNGVVKEEDPNKKLQEQINRMRSQMIMDGTYELMADRNIPVKNNEEDFPFNIKE